jgi:hypothetical protein
MLPVALKLAAPVGVVVLSVSFRRVYGLPLKVLVPASMPAVSQLVPAMLVEEVVGLHPHQLSVAVTLPP